MTSLSRFILAPALIGAALIFAGCVKRDMTITSDPPGADVWVNEQWHGKTPYRLPFKHYGVFGIRLEKNGFYPMLVKEPIKAPFYQRVGPDLIAEAVVPTTIHDRRELHYVLQPVNESDEITAIIERSEALVARSEPLLTRRREYDEQRQESNVPFLPEKSPRSAAPTEPRTSAPQEPRAAAPLNELPPVAPLRDDAGE
jgi:hypothetical protein